MKRASYREAIQWIADNDDTMGVIVSDGVCVNPIISMLLVADIFGVSSERVAHDVLRKVET